MAASGIGTLFGILELKTGPYQKGMRNAQRSAQMFSRKLLALGGVLAGVAGIRGLAGTVKETAALGEEILLTSRKLGIGVGSIQELRYAAKQFSGMEAKSFDTALQRMVRRLSEAANGAGEAKGALEELGVDAARLSAMDPGDAFLEIAEAMKAVGTEGDQVRLAMRLFDTEGVALVNTMNAGAEGIQEVADRMRELGGIMSLETIVRMKAVSDTMDEVAAAQQGLATGLSFQLGPTLQATTRTALVAGKAMGLFGESGGLAAQVIETSMIGVLTAVDAITAALWESLSLTAEGLSAIIKLMSLVNVGPISAGLKVISETLDEVAEFIDRYGEGGVAGVLGIEVGNTTLGLADTFKDELAKANQEYLETIAKMTDEGLAEMTLFEDGLKETTQAATQMGRAFEDSMTTAITQGGDLGDILKDLLQDVINIALRTAVTGPLGGSIGNIFSGIFGGPKAYGGPVSGGVGYQVGEKGPELFVPTTNGVVIPNSAITAGGGGAGETVVNQVINVTTGVAATVRAEIVAMLPAIRKNAVQAVDEAKLRRTNRGNY